MTTPTFDAIIFDLDGTLLDRNAVFVKVARDFYDAYLRNRVPHTRDQAVAMMVEWDGDGYTNREWMRSQWLKHWPDTGLDTHSLETWYRSAMVRNIQPDSEIIDYLTKLNRHQMPWGIVTNGPLTQRDKCKSAGLTQIAPFIIVSDEVGYYKPDPRIFRDALNATGLTSPENVIFVGDNPVADIDGAKRFGMMAAWLHMDRKYPPELLSPDYTINHVLDVRTIMGPM